MASLNANGLEAGSNTPDFILEEALEGMLGVLDKAIRSREDWYGVRHEAAVFREHGDYFFGDCKTAEEAVFQALGAASGVAIRANPDWDFSTASKEFEQIGNALLSRLSVAKDPR